MRQTVPITKLSVHPKNEYYFDPIEPQKWDDFKESIRTHGLFEAPIVTEDYVIISGENRVKACAELGIDEIEVEVRAFDNDASAIACLIDSNIQQRGVVGGSPVKLARRIKAMEEINGISKGNNQYNRGESGSETISHPLSSEELAAKFGMSTRNLKLISNLATLPEEFQQMVEDGRITQTAAIRIVCALSDQEKEALLAYLTDNDAIMKKHTEKQLAEYAEAIKDYEGRLKEFQEYGTGDNEDFLKLVAERDKIKFEGQNVLSELVLAKRTLKKQEAIVKKAEEQAAMLEDMKAQLSKLRKYGATVSQIIVSLEGFKTVVCGIAQAETIGCATSKESEKINSLTAAIRDALTKVSLMVGVISNDADAQCV